MTMEMADLRSNTNGDRFAPMPFCSDTKHGKDPGGVITGIQGLRTSFQGLRITIANSG